MYDYLIGMSFEEVVAELDKREEVYDFGGQSFEECIRDESWAIYIGGFWSDTHYDIDFDCFGRVVSIDFWDEGWD